MSYFNAFLLTIVTVIILVWAGPIALVPMTWWVFFGKQFNNNARTFGLLTLERSLMFSLVVSIGFGYFIADYLPMDYFVEKAIWLTSFSEIPIGIEKALSVESLGERDTYTNARAIYVYYCALIIFTGFMFLVLSRVEQFRSHVRQR